MKSLLLIVIGLSILSINVYSSDQLNSHEQFETGNLPPIINYDPEFRPPMPMPQLESGPLADDEEYDHLSSPRYEIIKTEDN
jgi:hypothetical protein